MKRNYQADAFCFVNDQELIRQTAFHEAGHATAIYLYNKQKQLPPVHFQITIKPLDRLKSGLPNNLAYDRFAAVVEGGRLIHSLPVALLESTRYFSSAEQDVYQTAFEADMINLLIGPLAEARHVALRDDEQLMPAWLTSMPCIITAGHPILRRFMNTWTSLSRTGAGTKKSWPSCSGKLFSS